jgi:hypothetical protein
MIFPRSVGGVARTLSGQSRVWVRAARHDPPSSEDRIRMMAAIGRAEATGYRLTIMEAPIA